MINIQIKEDDFNPNNVAIEPEEEVTWVNKTGSEQTVEATDRSFNSGKIKPGEKFSFFFRSKGLFGYRLESNPEVQGEIDVSHRVPGDY